MGKILFNKTGQAIAVKDGGPIKDACEQLGVQFSCEDGICGTCMVNIIDGENNLSELTQPEKDLDRDKKHRLACQCKIKKGNVNLEPEFV